MKTSRSGVGLLELVFALTIFSLFLVALFSLFSRSFRAHNFLESRQTLQGELLKIRYRLEADFGLSHAASVGIRHDVSVPSGERRDTVSCLGLDEWGEDANFTSHLRLPLWNRHIVYQSDFSEPGNLTRLVIEPITIPARVSPLASLESFPQDRILDKLNLSKNLHTLAADLDPLREEVSLSLSLLRKGGPRGLDNKASAEAVEAHFRWVPANTVPRL